MTGATANPSVREPRLRAARLSVAVGTLLLGVKVVAYLLTGSAAILSDALESIVNVVAACFALASVVVSARPADRDHPYGHGKVEDFSAGFEGSLILVAGALILYEAVPQLATTPVLQRLDAGIALVIAAGIANAALGLHVRRRGEEAHSAALVADGTHLLTDAYTSAAIVLGLVGVRITGWTLLDPIVASAMGLQLLWAGLRIVRASVGRLMDEADPALVGRVVDAVVRSRRPGLLEPHQLRVRRQGSVHHVDLHLVVPRFWSVADAHALEEDLTGAILEGLAAEGDVILHTDPCEPAHCTMCSVEACAVRSAPLEIERPWTVDSMTGPPQISAVDRRR